MEWIANEYSRQSSLQQAMAEQVLALLKLAGDERVLDVGCGDGKITARIAEQVRRGSVLGIDPSHNMVAFASSRFGPPATPNVRFEVGDAARLPYREEFDLVVSFNALHWVHEPADALRSIHAALRAGGRAVLRFVPLAERRSLEAVVEQACESTRWCDAFRGFQRPFTHVSAEAYRDIAERTGFRVDALVVRDEAWDFGSRDAFAAFCRATLIAWTGRLPEQERDRFINEVLDLYGATAITAEDANRFKFYQMDVSLTRLPDGD